MAILSDQDFLKYSGYTSCSNLDYVKFVLANVESIILDEVGTLFDTSTVTDFKIYGSGIDLVRGIGAWQTISSVIRGADGTPNTQTLTQGTHYQFKYYKEQPGYSPNPITGIKLLSFTGLNNAFGSYGNTVLNSNRYYNQVSNKLGTDQFLQISGTYGWGAVPADLKNLLYFITKSKLEYNTQMTKTGGGGIVTSERSLSRSRTLQISPKALDSRESLAKNIMSDPDVASLINRYKNYTTKNARIS